MQRSRYCQSLIASVLGIALAACPPTTDPDAGPADATARDAAATEESGRIDSGPCTVDDHGFCIRVPQTRDVPWIDYGGSATTLPVLDVDYVCTLDYQTCHGFVYVQSHATTCEFGCETTVDGAWISIGGSVSTVIASYNWGGNHANDSISVNHDDKVFKYYHSSFGWGWRACQPPDCTQVFQLDGITLIEDGCTMARTLPQVCVRVNEYGSVPPLIDSFEPCDGDPNYRDAGSGD
ncbi:MAG: hypothetical protein JXR83_20075 [Deltaproteobacteria bacterium]|nr:hypothetical protein [Deltaproteobacteria bacterium]